MSPAIFASKINQFNNGGIENINNNILEELLSQLVSISLIDLEINELKTDNVEPLTSVAETTLKLRTDEVKSKDIRNQILKNSPEKNEDFFVLPKVVE